MGVVVVVMMVTDYPVMLQGLTENQNRLLYMIDLYTHKAQGADDKNEWIRKPALMVRGGEVWWWW
jgi:hypothetical protein